MLHMSFSALEVLTFMFYFHICDQRSSVLLVYSTESASAAVLTPAAWSEHV